MFGWGKKRPPGVETIGPDQRPGQHIATVTYRRDGGGDPVTIGPELGAITLLDDHLLWELPPHRGKISYATIGDVSRAAAGEHGFDVWARSSDGDTERITVTFIDDTRCEQCLRELAERRGDSEP